MRKRKDKVPASHLYLDVTKEEYSIIYQYFYDSTHTILGHYLKSVLMQKPVTMYYRNKSLDELLAAMNRLVNGILSVNSLFDSSLENLEASRSPAELASSFSKLDQACEMHRLTLEEIRLELIKLYESCSQKSTGPEV